MQVAQMSDFVASFSSCRDMSVLSHIVAHACRSTTTLQRELPSLSFHPKERGRDSGASLPLPLTATASLPPSLIQFGVRGEAPEPARLSFLKAAK